MKPMGTAHRVLYLTLAAMIAMFAVAPAGAASPFGAPQTTPPPSQGGHGGSRGGSYPVKAVVKLGDQPVAGVTVTATAKNSATAVTDENGIAAFLLEPGTYTFTATNDSGTATAKAKVVASTTPVVVQLPLAPKAQ
jgi:hypothetical protein